MKDFMNMCIPVVFLFGTLSLGSLEQVPTSPNVQSQCPVPYEPEIYRDCSEIQAQCKGQPSGIFQIQPEGHSSFKVYCDFETDNGGWTVIQRRLDGSVNFQRRWNDYENGFGFLNSEFWLGNDKMAYLTAQKNYELRIELQNKYGNWYYAKYDHFRVGDAAGYYRLLLGDYSGNAGRDSLNAQRDNMFTTIDADHDIKENGNCAQTDSGGWWFFYCDDANLNGLYGVNEQKGIEWSGLPGGPYELQFTEMKIRPKI